jgi:glucose dehydrogenase
MTYMVDGRQFVVIAAGGHMFQYAQGVSDYLLAYALPAE